MILLDTHALLWYLRGEKRLGRKARTGIERAQARDDVIVSAISFWELSMFVERGRLSIEGSPAALRITALKSGLEEQPLDGHIAICAAELPPSHRDPADRFIVATAIVRGLTLVTADETLLNWKIRNFKTQDATN